MDGEVTVTIGELNRKLSDMSGRMSNIQPDFDGLPIFMWSTNVGMHAKVGLLELLVSSPIEGDTERIVGLAFAEIP